MIINFKDGSSSSGYRLGYIWKYDKTGYREYPGEDFYRNSEHTHIVLFNLDVLDHKPVKIIPMDQILSIIPSNE